MTDAEDHREQFDDEFRFLQWVQDPHGRWFCVEGVTTSGVSGPLLLGAPGGSPVVQRLLSLVNRGLVRVQPRSRSHDTFDIKISQLVGRREELVLEESCDVVTKGRGRARALVSEIRDGAFTLER